MDTWFGQQLYPVRLEWGRDGARRAAARGDIVVVVDVLRFTTTVATAAHYDITVRPCAMAGGHGEAPRVSRATLEAPELPAPLSPLGYLHRDPGSEVILESRNGAICTLAATGAQAIIAAALVNAAAVGARICQMLRGGGAVSVVACGERWVSPGEDGALRFALEDYLGAGAVLHGIGCAKSPEAAVCESAYLQSLGDLESILLRCGSAVELVDKGYSDDVGHASRLDIYSNVPLLRDGVFVPS